MELNSFGEWIQNRRKSMRLTQVALAEAVGCSTVMIRKIERNERKPSEQLARILAQRLRIEDGLQKRFIAMARGYYTHPTVDPSVENETLGYQTPVTVLSHTPWQIVSFIWPDDLRYYAGYRPCEFTPKRTQSPLPHARMQRKSPPTAPDKVLPKPADWLPEWQTEFVDKSSPAKTTFRTFMDSSAELNWHDHKNGTRWSVRFVPEAHGLRIWVTLTAVREIQGSYIVGHCLRLGNDLIPSFRKTISCVPFLSELLMQMSGNVNQTMTWMRCDGAWQRFPVPHTIYHTAAGEGVYDHSAGLTDHALIVRETPPREHSPLSYQERVAPNAMWETFSTGWYWERGTAIGNRYPADCIHVDVDFGPLKARESRTVQGKFYWVAGTKDELLKIWQNDLR